MAMGRSRSKSRAGWPDNLYPNRDGFKYRNPKTRKETSLGTDRARAFAAARKLNALLQPADDLVGRVIAPKDTVADAVKIFRAEEVPAREWAESTATNYENILDRIVAGVGTREVETFTVKDCATFIRQVTESARARQQFRLVFGWVLACAVEEGWCDTNVALATRKHVHKRKRDRLTIEVYNAIYKKAPTWLQIGMDLSLLTLLRREDVAALRFTDAREGKLHVMPLKTANSTGVRLRIAMSEPLAALVARARDDVASPFIVHRLPEKARPAEMRAKKRTHHTQVLPEQLSRAFADAREAAEIGGANPPTFHEIRSLGGALLREQGWSKEEVQALYAHTDATQTAEYLEGHEQPWTDVQSAQSLPR